MLTIALNFIEDNNWWFILLTIHSVSGILLRWCPHHISIDPIGYRERERERIFAIQQLNLTNKNLLCASNLNYMYVYIFRFDAGQNHLNVQSEF